MVATTLASSRSSISGRAESEPVPSITVRTLVSGLTIPWDIAFTPNGTMLYTQRSGVLSSRLKDGTVRTVTADMSDLFASGETGLMAIVVDPEFETNRRFYTCQGHSGPEVQVIAWTMNSDFSVATRASDPLVGGIPADASDGRHGGCRLRFGPAGYLWIATGDAAVGTHPQDASSLGGKVLRVNSATGTAADGNPTAGSLVYSYGHRNVQGLALRPGTNEMWSIEHGPTFDDEINLLVAGGNYGWDPVPGYDESVSMTDTTKFPDAVEAKWSSGNTTYATSGGVFLDGDIWGAWEGRLAVATLKDRRLRLFEFDDDGTYAGQNSPSALKNLYARFRTPILGPDGALYITTSNGFGNDQILRVTPKQAPAFAQDSYAVSVAESTAAGIVVASVDAQDFNHDSLTFSLRGADAALFRISDNTKAEIELNSALDFEMDRSHEVTVVATDTDNMSATTTLTVTVTDVNEPSNITGPPAKNFPENSTATIADYSANDPEEKERVTWSLSGTDDGFFEIDSNGVLRFKRSEDPPDREATRGNTYDVTVEASDGKDAHGNADTWVDDRFEVTVTVTDVDEAPVITSGPTSESVAEGHAGEVARFDAGDPEGAEVIWSLLGTDREDLLIGRTSGVVEFAASTDFEAPADSGRNNSYVVTVQASDGRLTATRPLAVTVTDVAEDGAVSLSSSQPQDGTRLTATLSDPDGGIVGTTWTWERRHKDQSNWVSVTGATTSTASSSYTPAISDEDYFLRVTASYTDRESRGQQTQPQRSAQAVSANPVRLNPDTNHAPEFADDAVTRSIPENSPPGTDIGAPVTATDRDPGDQDDLRYSLRTSDKAYFGIDSGTRQLQSKQGVVLDHETRSTYVVMVTASDPSLATDTQRVTITVTNVDERPTISGPTAPAYAEDRIDTVARYTAKDPEGEDVTWSLDGPDLNEFEIDADSGVVTFKNQPDFDTAIDNDYEITIRASDRTQPQHGTLDVTVRVTPVNEPPAVSGLMSVAWQENREGTIHAYSASDPEGVAAEWSLSGRDKGDFKIDIAGELRFVEPPDHEQPADANQDNAYEVTVRSFDGTHYGELAVTVTVSDQNESGTLELSNTLPSVGSPLNAILMEPDAPVTDYQWSWWRSDDQIFWDEIDGAAGASYRPVAADVSKWLQARVTYSDPFGSSDLDATSVNTVQAMAGPIRRTGPTGPTGPGGGGGGDFDVGFATFVVANGWSPADVGVASVHAARTDSAVVVYTAGGELSEETRVLLREASPAEVVIVGGAAAVSRDVRTQISAASPESGLSRITGADRADTAAGVARQILGGPSDAGRITLVVANGWSPPDIGAAAALAARSGRSAVLYTERGGLPEASAALLRDYQVARVILIGGTAAISAEVEDAIAASANEASVSRLMGADRIDTAAQAARRVLGNPAAAPDGLTLVIANGWSPPDVGVAAALAAATENAAVAYTGRASLPEVTAALIRDYRPTQIIITGGSAAVHNDVRTAITSTAPEGADIRRITGRTRTDTAARAARRILANL